MQNRKRDSDVRTDLWTLWEKARMGCFKRTASKHVYYLGWNRSPAQAGCMRQVLGPGAVGRPRGIRWRGRWEEGPGWGIHINPWLIHVNVWQKPLQYCKVISLQLKKKLKNKKTKKQIVLHLAACSKWKGHKILRSKYKSNRHIQIHFQEGKYMSMCVKTSAEILFIPPP